MPNSSSEISKQARLRLEAESRLKNGTTPRTNNWTISLDTLTLLHKLAIDPTRADDALKLLHELQTHQVELDMQHEQLETDSHELGHDLALFKMLFDYAPAGYFLVSLDGQIIESNRAGTRLLGISRIEQGVTHIENLITTEGRPTLAALLKRIKDGSVQTSCTLQSRDHGTGSSLLRITAVQSPDNQAILMIVSGYDRSSHT